MSNVRPEGSKAASSCAEPATTSLVPTATSTGARIAATSARLEVGFGLLGKGAERASHGIADIRERGRLERLRDALRQANTIDEMKAQAAEHGPAQAGGIREREKRRDARPHGVTHHVGTDEIEMIEQGAYVLGHAGAMIGRRIIELARGAVPAIVERDDAPAGRGQRRNPAGKDPVHLGGRSKT